MSNIIDAETAEEIRIGREPSDLYKLLFFKLPEYQTGPKTFRTLNVQKLSKDMGLAKQNIYKWLKRNKLPARRLRQIIDLPGSRLTMKDLESYITSE